MDIKYFNLFDGSLEFHSDKIIIFDKAKRNRIFLWVGVISGLIYSTTTLLRGYRQNDNLLILFGLILTISWTITSILRRKEFQKVENEIILSNINQVKFSIDKLDGNVVVKILTENGLQRRIKIVKEYNQDFDFKNLLLEHKIRID